MPLKAGICIEDKQVMENLFKKETGNSAIKDFLKNESFAGILLIFVTIIALIWANSKYYDSYHHLWHEVKLGLSFANRELKANLHHWINDGLMALFFFTIGLEIKREVIAGELSTLKKASWPIAAAIGGMLIPAGIYIFLHFNHPEFINGWGIPMATDIAFALGLLSLLGDKVNINLKIFLTALAIADDLGAILVIAIFYTDAINFAELINAGVFLIILITANRLGVRKPLFYASVGFLGVWMSFVYSGIHATIAGVLIAFTIPARPKISKNDYILKLEDLFTLFKKERPNDKRLLTKSQAHLISEIDKTGEQAHTPLQKLEHDLHPFVAFVILPLFALANAGVHIEGNLFGLLFHPVSIGIIVGLVAGKFLGVVLFSKLMVWLKLVSLPDGIHWKQIYGVGFLAGIGFTMSIFIADLAFKSDELVQIAKVGIFAASFLAAVFGMAILSFGKPPAAHEPAREHKENNETKP